MNIKFSPPLISLIILLFFFISGYLQAAMADESEELVMISSSVPALDPVYDFSAGHLHIIGVTEFLTRITSDGRVEPEFASSYRALGSNRWEVKIPANVRFWSGKNADAEAVKASLERSRNFAPEAGDLLRDIKVEVIDKETLHFITAKPDPGLPVNLSSKFLAIHNAESYGNKPNPYNLSAMDTTGMYRVVEYLPKQKMICERWEGYQGTQPKVKRIVYRAITDPQARLLAALSGEADIVRSLPPEGAAVIENYPDKELLVIKGPDIYYLYLNFDYPPFQDVRVRQALAWGVDREEIIELSLAGFGEVASSWYAQNPVYPEAAKMGFTEYRPDRAAELLDQAGWMLDKDNIRKKDGIPLSFRFFTTGIHKSIGPVLQSQWRKLGIQVKVEYGDNGFREAKLKSGDWETGIGGMGSFGDPRAVLMRQFGPNGYRNFSGYNNERMNSIIARLADTFAEDQRNVLALEGNQLVFETVPIIPLHTKNEIIAVNKKVKGLDPHFIWWLYLFTDQIDVGE